MMPDRKLAHARLLRSRHGEFSNFGAGPVGAENDGSMNGGAIAEGREDTVATIVESKIDKLLAALTEEKRDGQFQRLFQPDQVI